MSLLESALGATGGLAALGGGDAELVENTWAAAATRPTFAADASLAAEFPDLLGPPLAWLIPAAIRRDVAAGFFVIARCAADAIAAVPAVLVAEGGSSGTPAPPTRERRSGLEVKYLQKKNERGRRLHPRQCESERRRCMRGNSLIEEGKESIFLMCGEVGEWHLHSGQVTLNPRQ